jgi:cysteine desulfurase / selenocysteine lyase
MDIKKARSLFPYIQTGKVYFGHASTAPLSTYVTDRLKEYIHVRSETKIDDYTAVLKSMENVKKGLAEMINSTPDRIAFTDNTNNGINMLAQSVVWKPNDRVILNDIEFPANVYPFMNLKDRGVQIDFVKSHSGIVSTDDIINAITPETKLISVSQVQFLTGYRIDLETLGKVCKEKGIIFSVDAIQGLGAVRLDVQKSHIDFISCGTQKWLLGLQGLAFIYLSKDLQEKMHPSQPGWLSVEDGWNLLDFKLDLKKTADVFQAGTMNYPAIHVMDASLKLFHEFGFDEIEERILNNSVYFISGLKKIGIIPYLSDVPKKFLSGIVSFEHPSADKIFHELLHRNIISSLRDRVIRFAHHFYNTQEDIDKVVFVLKEILQDLHPPNK